MERKQTRRRWLAICLLTTLPAQVGLALAGEDFIRQPGMAEKKTQVASKTNPTDTANSTIKAPSVTTQSGSTPNVVVAPGASDKSSGAGNTADPAIAATPSKGEANLVTAPPSDPAPISGDSFHPRSRNSQPAQAPAVSKINGQLQIRVGPGSASSPQIISTMPAAKNTTPMHETPATTTESQTVHQVARDDWTGISLSSPTVADDRPTSDMLHSAGDSLQWVTRGESVRSTQDQFATPTFSASNLQSEKSNGFYSSIPMVKKPTNATSGISATADSTAGSASPESAHRLQERQEKRDLASMVSHKILASRPRVAQENIEKKTVGPVESLPGWQAIAEQLQQRMVASRNLMRRRAFLSARQEAESGVVALVQFLDGIGNRYHCEPAWAAALRALQECEDFYSEQRTSTDSRMLQRLIESHETPALKDADASQLAPMTAAQHYRLYALACIEVATQNHPLASDVLYAMGRTYQAQAESGEGRGDLLRWRAITLYRAAIKANPNNAIASNELGYLLLQMDRPRDAQVALIASVNTQVSAHALQNLIEASRRLRDQSTMNWATSTLASLNQPAAVSSPAVVEVSPQAFAALSPLAAGPQPASKPVGFQNP